MIAFDLRYVVLLRIEDDGVDWFRMRHRFSGESLDAVSAIV